MVVSKGSHCLLFEDLYDLKHLTKLTTFLFHSSQVPSKLVPFMHWLSLSVPLCTLVLVSTSQPTISPWSKQAHSSPSSNAPFMNPYVILSSSDISPSPSAYPQHLERRDSGVAEILCFGRKIDLGIILVLPLTIHLLCDPRQIVSFRLKQKYSAYLESCHENKLNTKC